MRTKKHSKKTIEKMRISHKKRWAKKKSGEKSEKSDLLKSIDSIPLSPQKREFWKFFVGCACDKNDKEMIEIARKKILVGMSVKKFMRGRNKENGC